MENKLLNKLSALMFAAIILAVVFSIATRQGYRSSNKQMLEVSVDNEHIVSLAQLHQWLDTGIPEDIIIVDLRDKQLFGQDHITGSVNIPAQELMKYKSRKHLNQGKTKILVGNDEASAHAIRMILLAKGFEDIKVLSGGYSYAKEHAVESFNPSYGYYKDEKAAWDYIRFMPQTASGQTQAEQTQAGIPEKKTEVVAAQGGC